MTVAVGFYCQDGIVIAADSMLTPSLGGLSVGHHKGQKVHLLAGGQIFAFAGDQGQAARFQIMAHGSHGLLGTTGHPIDYPIALTTSLIAQFNQTGIGQTVNVNTLLGYMHLGLPQLYVFEGVIQPRLLDANHYYVALGSGKLSADPFLRFLTDTFCTNGLPTVAEATLLAIWAVEYVIVTNPGGVAGPTKVAVIEGTAVTSFAERELSSTEIDDHRQAVASAQEALRSWRNSLGGANDDGPLEVTVPPTP